MVIPKKTKEDRVLEKLHRQSIKKASKELKNKLKNKDKNKPSKLARKKANKNSSYWREKADKLFMEQGHNKPCVICRDLDNKINTEGTCFHHHVAKSTCKALRYDLMNMVILCPTHHNFSNEIAAHSTNAYAQLEYMNWVSENMPEKFEYCEEYQHSRVQYSYKEAYEEFVELKKQGKVIQKVVVC